MKNDKQFLLVTTAHKGVFAGYGTPTNQPTIELTEARMCVQWSQSMHGVMGLAAMGPSKECRIGPAVPSIILRDVTSVVSCSKESEAKWKDEPWS